MKKIETIHWNPEFCPKETGALCEYLEDEYELPEDDAPYVCTKKEFLALDVYDEGHFDTDDEDEIEKASYFAGMLERIKELKDDDILEIPMGYSSY